MSERRLFQVRMRWASCGLILVLMSLVTFSAWRAGLAEVSDPSPTDREVTRFVTRLMQSRHLLRHTMDDETSRRGFKLFLDGLDPMKCYFYQSDIDEFKRYEDKLDDMLSQRYDTRFAQLVFKRFLERIDERVTLVDELLKGDFDFTLDEEMITDPDRLQYPKDAAEARERWRQRLKYDLLVLKADKSAEESAAKTKPSADGPSADDKLQEPQGEKQPELKPVDPAEADREARDKLSKRYRNFQRRMNLFDNDELLETYLTSITSAFDPHTSYMSPTTLENFKISLQLNLEGIGAQLQDQDGRTVVANIVPGGAADKQGKLKKDDEIISVAQGDDGEEVDVVGMKLNDVVQLIRGKAGTVVRLGVIPANTKEAATYSITRAKIELEDSAAHGEVFEVGSKPDGSPFQVGVLDLPSFYQDMRAAQDHLPDYRSATRDVERILADFKKQGVDAVVLDLRRNGGGSLVEAVDLTGLFIDQGPVVQVMDPDKRVQNLEDTSPGMAWDGPLVVLTSKLSASASEILAGAIQDYKRGLVVGDTATHGKGTVQSLQNLGEAYGVPIAPNLGALKITVQQFFRPNGDSTQKRGVLSDIVLPSVTDHMDIGEADLDFAIDFQHIKRSKFSGVDLVNEPLIAKLRAESAKRVGESPDFGKLLKRIELYQERKAHKAVTLNEKKFFEEGKEANADKAEEERLAEEVTDSSKIKRDYYLDEILLITRDYVNTLRQNKFARVN